MSDTQSFITEMVSNFKPEKAVDLDTVFQFEFKEGDNYYIEINSGECALSEGIHEDPCVTLKLKFDTLKKLYTGELDGMKAFMFGKLKVSGDMMLATRLTKLFSAN